MQFLIPAIIRIRLNARLLVREMLKTYGLKLALDEPSVAWLDAHIEILRTGGIEPNVQAGLVQVFGSFFGECLRRTYYGRWCKRQNAWAVAFGPDQVVFPFNKVQKHFQAEGESILCLFRTIPRVMKIAKVRAPTPDEAECAEGLRALQTYEYLSRKYRARGDAYYDDHREHFSMESHNQAHAEDEKTKIIVVVLTARLGPPGRLVAPRPEDMEQIRRSADALADPWSEESNDFDDACFFARYPNWAISVPRLAAAHARWKDDPRFLREAPMYKPVKRSWYCW